MVFGGKARVAEGAVLYKKGVLRQKTLRTVALTLSDGQLLWWLAPICVQVGTLALPNESWLAWSRGGVGGSVLGQAQ